MSIEKFVGQALEQIDEAYRARAFDPVEVALKDLGEVYLCWLDGAKAHACPQVALRAIADTARAMIELEDISEKSERFYLLCEVVVAAEECASKLEAMRG